MIFKICIYVLKCPTVVYVYVKIKAIIYISIPANTVQSSEILEKLFKL